MLKLMVINGFVQFMSVFGLRLVLWIYLCGSAIGISNSIRPQGLPDVGRLVTACLVS